MAATQRPCVLPAGRRPNLASAVLGACLRRLSGDYLSRFGHLVFAVETFTDPARHTGSCYAAAGFSAVGATAGFGWGSWQTTLTLVRFCRVRSCLVTARNDDINGIDAIHAVLAGRPWLPSPAPS